MTALKAISERRAVRNYTDEPVSEETVKELIDAATQAPSAMNVQPWSFVVVQDKDLLNEISRRAVDLMRDLPIAPEMRTIFDDPHWNIFYNAGTLIVVCARPEGQHPDWDCCLAAENLLIAAREKGLGTCVIGFSWTVLEQPDIKERLGIPESYHAVIPIIVGHPREFPPSHGRKPPEILSWKVAARV